MIIDLNDLDDLAQPINRRGLIIKSYDLESLKKMKEINCKEIQKLISTIQSFIQNIKSEQTKNRITIWLKGTLVKTYKNNLDFNPEEFFNNKTAHDFSRECISICSFDKITQFIHDVYRNLKLLNYNGDHDFDSLYSIFDATKNSCKNLGIFSLYPLQLQDAYMDPESKTTYDLGIRPKVLYEKLEKDAVFAIGEIPYTIRVPDFRFNGEIMDYLVFPVNKATCYYYSDRYDELAEQAKQKQQS